MNNNNSIKYACVTYEGNVVVDIRGILSIEEVEFSIKSLQVELERAKNIKLKEELTREIEVTKTNINCAEFELNLHKERLEELQKQLNNI